MFPGDLSGCGYYRMIYPAQACQLAGHDVSVLYDQDSFEYAYRVENGRRRVTTMSMGAAEDCDVVVMQRPTRDIAPDIIRHLQAAGKRVVIDLDDNFDRLHPQSTAAMTMKRDRRERSVHVHESVRLADVTVCSTQHLADHYGRWGHTVVVRNRVPDHYLTIDEPSSGAVGWSGAPVTRHQDVKELRGVFGRFQREGWPVWFIGTDDGHMSRLYGVRTIDHVTGWQSIDDYPHAVARLALGAVPLADQAFNHSKSWLKGLELAALGVPFAASPLPEYVELVERFGIGRLVTKPKNWYRELMAAYRDGIDRDVVARQGLTYSAAVPTWWKAWTTA